MDHIVGESRDQLVLYTETIDSLIEDKNPVRIIEAYVNKLDLRTLGFQIKTSLTGRPSYTAAVLLKIFMYGYLNKIRSSRKLEKECLRNTELIWLTCRLAPDFKTIADFRRDNVKAIKNLFKEFLKVCHKLELISFKLIAIDGTKIGAQNSTSNIYKRDNIEETMKKIEEKIEKYIEEMEKNDKEEVSEFEFLSTNIEKKLDKLKTRREKAELIKKMFEEDPELEVIYANDQDSRIGSDKGKADVFYNAQIAVDEKHKLIVVAEVTNENNDVHQLGNMVKKAEETKKELGISPEEKTIHVLDAGYYCETEIVPIIEAGFDVYVPSPRDEHKARTKKQEVKEGKVPAREFECDRFQHDKQADQMICPEGARLIRESEWIDNAGRLIAGYRCGRKDCPNQSKCTNDKSGRRIKRSVRKEDMDRFDEKVRGELGKSIVSKRKELAEHPFGTIKNNLGYKYFMQKGNDKVNCEFNLTSLMYNLMRVLNIVGFDRLMAAI